MDVRVRADKRFSLVIFLLAVFFLVPALLASLMGQLGIFLIPLIAPPLCAIFLYDRSKYRILSVLIAVVAVAVDAIFNLAASFNALAAVIMSIFVVLSIKKGYQKSVSAAVSTVFLAVLFLVYAYIYAFDAIDKFDIALATSYLSELFESIKSEFFEYMKDFYANTPVSQGGVEVSDELIAEIINLYFNLLISVVLVVSFALVGFSFKGLSLIINLTAEDSKEFGKWRFVTSSVFAYFFLALWFLQIFVSGGQIVGIAILNLYEVFAFVYAYLGFGLACYFFTIRLGRRGLATFIVLLLIGLFSSAAIQVLSVVGAFSMITYNRARAQKLGGDNNKNGG